MAELVLTRTPLRVSFFGGGTDLPGYYGRYGGRVLSFGIDRYVHVAVKPSWTGGFELRCGEPEHALTVDQVSHGIVRECLRVAGHTGGLEIVSLSDIPTTGSGLGSSGAFAVGLLHALFALKGSVVTPAELAELACHIEIDRLGEPIGKQDQYAAAFGGCHEYRSHPDGTVGVDPVPLAAEVLDRLCRHARFFYTGRTRPAADVLADQRARIGATEKHLHTLREIVTEGRRRPTGGRPQPAWAQLMARMRRKTLIVCPSCHDSIHNRKPAHTLT